MKFMQKLMDTLKMDGEEEMEGKQYINNPIQEIKLSLSKAHDEIRKANKLADIANKTTDREEFYQSVEEIENILTELSKYEDDLELPFSPSDNLRKVRERRDRQIVLLEKRIAEKEKASKAKHEKISEEVSDKIDTVNNAINAEETNLSEEKEKQNVEMIDFHVNSIDLISTEESGQADTYKSNRSIIKGVDLYFIDIAREIVAEKGIKAIPLMREYHLTEHRLDQIIHELQEASILDFNKNINMSADELEKFFDIYEPSIFKCTNSEFNKELFMVMGEIIFDKGIEDTYNALSADEVVDYLTIMEKLNIISYDDYLNKYNLLVSKDDFYKICECIPNLFFYKNRNDLQINHSEDNFDNMSGIEFEYSCAEVLRKNGFENIEVTQESGDHGIDILAEKEDITYAIQCKCYSSDIGNAAVQQAYTGTEFYHRDIAVVLTNRYFTPQAIEEAKTLGVKLWDRDKLHKMIRES